MVTATATKVRLKPTIEIPAEDHDIYVRLAEIERKTVDQVMSERLTDCSAHNAVKGIWFGDQERKSLEEALGVNVSTASDVLGAVRKNVRVKIGTINVLLKPHLLERLKSRCFGQDFDKWLEQKIRQDLEEYTNLR
jgi:hypothetical protein